jgi:hypothetical protein
MIKLPMQPLVAPFSIASASEPAFHFSGLSLTAMDQSVDPELNVNGDGDVSRSDQRWM